MVGPKSLLRAWGRAEIYFWINQKIEFFDGQKSDFGPLKLVGNHTKCFQNKSFTQAEFDPTLERYNDIFFGQKSAEKSTFSLKNIEMSKNAKMSIQIVHIK